MPERVSKWVPLAERIVEFSKEDFRQNNSIGNFDESLLTDENLEKFAKEALVIIDGNDILQYAEEFPIVVYRCNKDICYAVQPEPRLNSFVLKVVVSTGVEGKKFSVGTGKIESEFTEFDTIAYYEDPFGIKHHIIQYDICRFLLKKPNLVVSEEGVLLFFTEDEILATTDCNQYAWIIWDDVIKNCTLENINAYREYCEITLVEGEDTLDDFGKIKEEAPRHILKLDFDLSLVDHIMIHHTLTKIS